MDLNERSSHPSRTQIETLLQYLEKNPSLAKGFSKVASARDASRKHWERLSVQLNSMEGSAKTWKKWNKYWADKKSAVKKKAATRSAARCRAGDGLTEVEERIVRLMGGERFVNGDRQMPIHPFSELKQNDESSTFHSSSPINISLGELATHTPIVPTETLPGFTSQPRIVFDYHYVDTTPSRQGVHPIRASPTPLHRYSHESPPPSPLPPRYRTPRRRRGTLPSLATQLRSQLTSATDRLLTLEEQRLQLDRRNTDILEAVTSIVTNQVQHLSETNMAVAQALQSIGDGLKMLAERWQA